MTHKTIAVVGHVDHGKSALVEALTSTQTDTLAEEQARGLSITLGFAHRRLPTGLLHFVDAPGHADFVRTTVSGLSGVDAVLLVISAADGIEVQTKEHLKLALFMGTDQVIFALTKRDLVTDAELENRRSEVTALAKAFGLSGSRIIACSANTPTGLRDLESALQDFLNAPSDRPTLPGFYLPIDRVFSRPGVGTIVTGTLIGREIEAEAEAIVGTHSVTVRGIQVAGEQLERAAPGSRVALNLRGIDHRQIKKGDVLHAPKAFAPTERLDVVLSSSNADPFALKHMQQVSLLAGTRHVAARVRLFEDVAQDHEFCFAQIEPTHPIVAYRGQPIVLRNPASSQSNCAGEVLDPEANLVRRRKPLHLAVLHAARTENPEMIAHAIADRDRGEVNIREIVRLSLVPSPKIQTIISAAFDLSSSGIALRMSDIQRAKGDFLEQLSSLHKAHPIRPGHPAASIQHRLRQIPESIMAAAERDLIRSGEILECASGLAQRTHNPKTEMTAEQVRTYEYMAVRLLKMGLHPAPFFDDDFAGSMRQELIDLLVHDGVAVQLYNHALRQHIILHSESIIAAEDALAEAFPNETRFTTGEARAVLSTNRKTVVPLLELLDARGVTRRDGDFRIIIA